MLSTGTDVSWKTAPHLASFTEILYIGMQDGHLKLVVEETQHRFHLWEKREHAI